MNVDNRTLFIADNLDIMRGMDSDTIDLIYLDPPFNSNRNYKAPIGSPAEGAEFKDIWADEDIKDEWHGHIAAEHEELYQIIQASEAVYDKSMKIYLTAMAVSLFEMHRILKPTGSIYLHCDPTASHYLKLILDDLFGKNNFRNEIVWQRASGRAKGSQHESRSLGRDTDSIFHYSKSDAFVHNAVSRPLTEAEELEKFPIIDSNGRRYNTDTPIFCQPSMGARPNLCYEYKGVVNPHPSGWRVSKEKLIGMDEAGYIIWRKGKRPLRKAYADEYKGKPIGSLWTDISIASGSERTGYPTQKPLALLDRIIKASSNENDMVLDPFCGCATACVAAERLHRHWVGIDISPAAEDITKLRLTEEVDAAASLFNPLTDVLVRKDAPERTDNAEEIAVQQRLPAYQTHKPELFGRQQGRCNGCQYEFLYRNLTVDHIVPQSIVQDDRIENLQLLCASCNSRKGTGTHEELIQKLIDDKILRTE